MATGWPRSIINQVNAAWLGNLAAPAPKGLASLTGHTVAIGDLANLDTFALAVSAAESQGANVTGWVLSPGDALRVATLKTGTGPIKR